MARLLVGVHVVYSMDHTTYSYTINYVSMRLMLLIDVKNGLGLISEDI